MDFKYMEMHMHPRKREKAASQLTRVLARGCYPFSTAPPLCESIEKLILPQHFHVVGLDTDNDL